jgi:hypothetical protein
VGGNGQPTETPEPTETQEPTETPTYTAPPTTTPVPTTLPPTTTPAPVDHELEWAQENRLTEEATDYMRYLDTNKEISYYEISVGEIFDNLYNRGISANTVADILDIVKNNGISGIEYLGEIADTPLFEKIVEDDLIKEHESRVIDKSFRYSDLQTQLEKLNEKGSENFLKTYEVVLDKSQNGRTEPEKFLYGKIDEHLPEFKIGEDGFLYYGKEKIFKVDDKNLYVKWLDKPYDPAFWKSEEIWIERGCSWKYSIDKEFSLRWSEFIDEETGIPWNTKYYSVEPIEEKFKNAQKDAHLLLNFDTFGFNGLGYKQIFNIYI